MKVCGKGQGGRVDAQAKPMVVMMGPSLGSKGGMAAVARQYFDAGICERFDVRFIASYDDGGKALKLRLAVAAYLQLKRLLPYCSIMHVHMASNASFDRKRVFLEAARKAGVKTVIHLHGGGFADYYRSSTRWKQDLIRRTFERAGAVVVLSPEWQAFLREKLRLESRTFVLRNGVPSAPRRTELRRMDRVLFLGRLCENKDPATLLKAAKRIVAAHPSTRFVFAGDGDSERYAHLAEKLGVAHCCSFAGWVFGAEKEALFARCGIYCLPSRQEGLPMALLEALSRGLAVVATPVGGVASAICDEKNGLLTPVGNDEMLARQICRLIEEPEFARELGLNGVKTVESEFGLAASLCELELLYDSLLSRDEA